MKCTNQIQRYDPTVAYVQLPPKEDCGGEMEEVGAIPFLDNHWEDEQGIKQVTPASLYQCNICKTIKLV